MKPICKKCLIEGISISEFESTLKEYLETLPQEQKVDPDTYRDRLSLCDKCTSLSNGICRICGCFVMIRAAKRLSCCPAVEPKW
ncbi:MAG: hypothetical protein GXX10_09545 [Clostridiaceae bacterium]|nr:hypothetical protein [Clostridiaceae bacterium]